MDVADMAAELSALGVPDDLARDVWEVARANITSRAEVAEWWTLFRDGATPLVEDEDRDFVAEAFALLPEPPYGPDTWSDWTGAVKEATGRKGKGLFMPLRKAVTGRERGPEMADVMRLLQKKPTL
jgi:glutamyl-tRNA synthetase